jgi:hypothetical protein
MAKLSENVGSCLELWIVEEEEGCKVEKKEG